MAHLTQMNLRMGLRYIIHFQILIITCGCGSPYVKHTLKEYREIKILPYQDKVSIMTEPPGCRIYINEKYIGESPITTVLDGGTISLREVGTFDGYTNHNFWNDDEKRRAAFIKGGMWCDENIRQCDWRISNTTWTDTYEVIPQKQVHWIIKACKEGMDCTTRQIDFGDSVFKEVTARLNLQNISTPVVAERNVLLELRPTVVQVIPLQPQATNSGTVNTSNLSEEYKDAQVEYESALQAYNTAKSKVDEAKMMNSVNRLPGGTGNPLFDLGVKSLASGEVQMQQRNLEMAKERLDRAKERLGTLEWKK
jgi:hypothetical protein